MSDLVQRLYDESQLDPDDYRHQAADRIEQLERSNKELREALVGIKSEFERLREEAPSMRDALYLDGVLAVIDSKSGAALSAADANKGKENGA